MSFHTLGLSVDVRTHPTAAICSAVTKSYSKTKGGLLTADAKKRHDSEFSKDSFMQAKRSFHRKRCLLLRTAFGGRTG